MANKTIYVSTEDEPVFEEAKNLAGEALSSVISKALKEFVVRHSQKGNGMNEVSVLVGVTESQREQRFIGSIMKSWHGFSTDKKSFLSATIYQTQKGNFAVYLAELADASLVNDPENWEPLEQIGKSREASLIIGQKIEDFKDKLPKTLYPVVESIINKSDRPIEYLDI